uniref:Uncharacterized protein n=1 Tax=Setaria italica TaxID=4555 RepID=K3Z1I2_SETIT
MIRPIQSCFNVSHVDRNLGTASPSVHRAGFCDYINFFLIRYTFCFHLIFLVSIFYIW